MKPQRGELRLGDGEIIEVIRANSNGETFWGRSLSNGDEADDFLIEECHLICHAVCKPGEREAVIAEYTPGG